MRDDGRMKTPVLYGIPNCATVRKARAWLTSEGVAHQFHDLKKAGVPEEALASWLQALGHSELVNRRGTTWRQLDAATQASATDNAAASVLLQAHPSAIRRPVVEWPDGAITVGFEEAAWAERCKALGNA